MSIDFTSEKRKILEDHKHFSLCDERNLDYLVGMIREALDDIREDDRQMELFQGTTSEKISQHKTDGIEYSDAKGIGERRVKSYGFFKNEYYDD